MTYSLKLSSKNQVTIPVALLKDLNLANTTSKSSKKATKKTTKKTTKTNSTHLMIVKNLQGKYELVNPIEIFKNLQGSLKSPKNLERLSDEQLEEQIEIARNTYIQNKYSNQNASN
jgi:hypothetical protein